MKPFKKGKKGKDKVIDPRINRLGRPKNFDTVRRLFQEVAGEPLDPKDPNLTRIVAMARLMSSSSNPSDRSLFLAYAVGRPKDVIDLTSKGESIVPKETDGQKYDRALSKLVDALGEIIPPQSAEQDGELGAAKPPAVVGPSKPSG